MSTDDYFFSDFERVEALRTALEKRRGTPFRAGMGKPGAGYDCWHLVVDVYEEAGLPVGYMRDYHTQSLNWGKFNKKSLLIDFLHDDPQCRQHLQRLEPDETIMAGDLVAIRQGLSCNHLAIAVSDRLLWHVPRGGSVSSITLASLPSRYLYAIYRIVR
jgi:cell wall-associated NlpC family hydrolase